jgi:sigma-B regulation protein RsbU (phosphoserine phosphatase)
MQSSLGSRTADWLKAHLPSGLAGGVLYVAVWFLWLLFARWAFNIHALYFTLLQIIAGIVLVSVTIPFAWQMARKYMLWSLRNKLVLTYLLIGLAPVILFVTLVLISSYIAAGQFAIHLIDSRLQSEVNQMSVENGPRADFIARTLEHEIPPLPSNALPDEDHPSSGLYTPRMRLHRDVESFVDGAPIAQGTVIKGKIPLGLPPWEANLRNGEFHDLVLDGGDLYLVAVNQQRLHDGRMFTLVSSVPVDNALMNMIAAGLGRAVLFPQSIANTTEQTGTANSATNASQKPPTSQKTTRAQRRVSEASSAEGGAEPAAVNIADIRVRFLSTLKMTDWGTGDPATIAIEVDSRPSLLYEQLFGASLGGIVTSVIRIFLVVLCVVFALIELLALWMAIRLSRTITASVADLYQATKEIDRGILDHRIGVTRTDQLAELSRSFNKMTESLQRLLIEQQEKERLQNEISIAQEVQANLFPHHISNLLNLELHGVCRPARSVSGDYYDFLVFHEEAHNGQASRRETGVGIALGDISGKGISAALLMATLHSAVRAYRFASEELIYSESTLAGLMANREERGGDCDELFQSPGRILSLLNRHLYRSTQPEKYATLFLAHYDAASAMLTYSNAGQLPPLVLTRNGAIHRLDRGGTVVGLMDGMKYEEGRLQMEPGDIMVAYSDGVTEPENDFGEFGEERMMEVVRRYRDQPLHIISTQVMQALDAWIGAQEQPDDITLVLARQT